MKKSILSIYIVFSLFLNAFLVFGIGEKTYSIGKSAGWKDMDTSTLTEADGIRPFPVLALSSAGVNSFEFPLDMYLSFDEGSPARFRDQSGHYEVTAAPAAGAVAGNLARRGGGAASFTSLGLAVSSSSAGSGPLTIKPLRGALFYPGTNIGDFTIEFWLCPSNPENGEQILAWSSTLNASSAAYVSQRIQCTVLKNRLQWTFTNFFTDAGGQVPEAASIFTLTGSPVLPKTYSHHLIRYNSNYGLLEYLVDGRQEAVVYTTSTGREGGEIYTPFIGSDSVFTVGSRYTGIMDELLISPQYIEKPVLAKYPLSGGRAESRTIDLGSVQSSLVRLEASAGRIFGTGSRSEYTGSDVFTFSDHSEIRFYLRCSNNPYQWDMPWIPVPAGSDLPQNFRGRYVQVAVELFPSGNCETTPYLEELRLVYRNIESPRPPNQVTALARDGAVELSWRVVADSNLGGYLVYIGTGSGEYYGEIFNSPLDAGNRTSMRIDGLVNGTLYFFAVASYDKEFREPGEFSRETAARPQKDFLAIP